jgi:hypothetical protein
MILPNRSGTDCSISSFLNSTKSLLGWKHFARIASWSGRSWERAIKIGVILTDFISRQVGSYSDTLFLASSIFFLRLSGRMSVQTSFM